MRAFLQTRDINMARVLFSIALAVMNCMFLNACTSLFDKDAKSTGAIQIIEKKAKFVKVDLAALLDPKNMGQTPNPPDEDHKDLIENAFTGFYDASYGDETDQILRRNRVQSRLIAASNETCADFREKLRQLQAEPNFFLGAVTTILAGAGAVVPSVAAAQILSGSAGVVSGIRAEFNQTYFAQLAVEVITKGIEKKRDDILVKINKKKANLIKDYTVERAVSDALKYHGACNLISGLEEASDRLTVADDPGFKRLKQIFEEAGVKSVLTLETEPNTEPPEEDGAKESDAGD